MGQSISRSVGRRTIRWITLTTTLGLLPLLLDPYHLILLSSALALSIGCLGVNLLMGYTGLLSLGHAAYFGLGAYAGALLSRSRSTSSLASWRAQEWPPSSASSACGQPESSSAFSRWRSARSFTRSSSPARRSCTTSFSSRSSPFGLSLCAIRDNAVRAEFVGIRVRDHRWRALVFSAAFTAVARRPLGPARPSGDTPAARLAAACRTRAGLRPRWHSSLLRADPRRLGPHRPEGGRATRHRLSPAHPGADARSGRVRTPWGRGRHCAPTAQAPQRQLEDNSRTHWGRSRGGQP